MMGMRVPRAVGRLDCELLYPYTLLLLYNASMGLYAVTTTPLYFTSVRVALAHHIRENGMPHPSATISLLGEQRHDGQRRSEGVRAAPGGTC